MREDGTIEAIDVEMEFRRRLAAKLRERGYQGPELEQKVEELLRKGVKLRLNIPEILGTPPSE